MRPKPSPGAFLRKNWLLAAILAAILLAAAYPRLGSKHGPLKTELTVKYGAVSVIFFISGLSLKTDSIYGTFRRYELHLFVQAFTFVFVPIAVHAAVAVLSVLDVNPWVLKGLMTAACMPPPVSSAVILTRSANGNETAAIFNSIFGSFLGILVTPLLLLINLGATTIVPLAATLVQLTLTVLLPLFLGQAVRNFTNFRGHKLPLNAVAQCALLLVIYSTFCDTFEAPETGLSATDILTTVLLVLLMQVAFLGISYAAANRFRAVFKASDVIAIVFCSTHKSLTLGIPILRIMFHGFSHLSQISLPLLVYHPTQIILGGFLVSHLKEWALKCEHRRLPV